MTRFLVHNSQSISNFLELDSHIEIQSFSCSVLNHVDFIRMLSPVNKPTFFI